MIRLPKHVTFFLPSDSPSCPVGLHALRKRAAMGGRGDTQQVSEALTAIGNKKWSPASSQVGELGNRFFLSQPSAEAADHGLTPKLQPCERPWLAEGLA